MKCVNCPLQDSESDCPGEGANRILCAWADAGEDVMPHIENLTSPDEPHISEGSDPEVPEIVNEPESGVQATQRFVPFTPEVLAAINACPHRECRTGCERTLCRAGRGDQWGQTTLENCRDCLGGVGARNQI